MSRYLKGNKIGIFKLLEGKNGPTPFLPLNANFDGQRKHIKGKETKYLTEDQAKHIYIYRKVELGSVINIDMIKQEMEQDLDRLDDISGEMNPHHEIILKRQKGILQSYHKWNSG